MTGGLFKGGGFFQNLGLYGDLYDYGRLIGTGGFNKDLRYLRSVTSPLNLSFVPLFLTSIVGVLPQVSAFSQDLDSEGVEFEKRT